MEGRGCWLHNVLVERLWKSIKYEEVYLHAYETISDARRGIGRYLEFWFCRIMGHETKVSVSKLAAA